MLGWLRTRQASETDISPRELAQALSGPNPPLLLDVRTPREYAAAHIQGARLLPLAELGRRLSEVPKERPLVCVCRSGHRSGAAARQLRASGYTAQNMAGGMLRWQGPVATGAQPRETAEGRRRG